MNLRGKPIKKIVERSCDRRIPWHIFPNINKKSYTPVKIIIAPTQIDLEGFCSEIITLFQQELSGRLARFFQRYYLSENLEGSICFLGSVWGNNEFNGKDSIDSLFASSRGEPTLVLTSTIKGNRVSVNMAYWGLSAKKYSYSTVLDGYKYGELEKQKNSGESLQFLEDFLVNNYCLIASWIADYHHLNNYGVSPLLPKILPEFIGEISDKNERDRLVETVFAGFDRIYQILAEERPELIPLLYLQLAKSAIELSKNTLAKQLTKTSIATWLKLNRVANIKELDFLKVMSNYLRREDEKYIQQLNEIYGLLNEPNKVKLTEQYLTQIQSSQQFSCSIESIFKKPIFQYKIG